MERKDIIKELKRCLAYLMLGIMPVTTTACNTNNTEIAGEEFSLDIGANYTQIEKELEKYVEFDEMVYLGTFHKINKMYNSRGLANIWETGGLQNFDVLVSLDEFASITGNTDIKYGEAIATIINNNHVESKYQVWFADALDVLKTEKPNYCLAALNSNFSKLKFKYVDSMQFPVMYDVFTGIVYVRNDVKDNDELLRELLIEEVIGKGLTHGFAEVGGKRIFYTTCNYYANLDPTVLDRHIYIGGIAEQAGFAKEIAALCLNKKIDSKQSTAEFSYIFKVLREKFDISDEEYMNNGWEGLKNVLYDNGYGRLYDTLFVYDMTYEGIEHSENDIYFANAPLFTIERSNSAMFNMTINEFINRDYRDGKSYEETSENFERTVKGPLDMFDLCPDLSKKVPTDCVGTIPVIDSLIHNMYDTIPKLYDVEYDFNKTRK